MQKSEKFSNPFYGLLLVAGISFALTATAYGVMAFRDRDRPSESNKQSVEEHPLMAWMSLHGERALGVELGILALGTFGAIATDDYWQRRKK